MRNFPCVRWNRPSITEIAQRKSKNISERERGGGGVVLGKATINEFIYIRREEGEITNKGTLRTRHRIFIVPD